MENKSARELEPLKQYIKSNAQWCAICVQWTDHNSWRHEHDNETVLKCKLAIALAAINEVKSFLPYKGSERAISAGYELVRLSCTEICTKALEKIAALDRKVE
jgi:hypothetical protein